MKKQIISVVLAFGIVCLLFSAAHAQPNNAPVNKSGTDSYSFQMKDFSKSYPGKPSAPISEAIKCVYDKCPQTDKNAPPNPNITRPNPQLKDFIQGKPVNQQPQTQNQQPQTQNQQPQQSQAQQNVPPQTGQQQLKPNLPPTVTKTKTIPDPNNAIFVSKPRTEEEKKQNQPRNLNSIEETRDLIYGKKELPKNTNQPQPQQQHESIKYQLMEQDMGGKPASQQTQNQNRQNTQVQNQTQNQQQNCVRDPKYPQLISCDIKGGKK